MRTSEIEKRVLDEARSWIGTPWMEGGSCAKGASGGVDCSRFVWSVFYATGFVSDFKFPVVPGIYCMDRKNPSLILSFLRKHSDFVSETDGQDLRPCDIVTFREGMVVHHCGIVMDDLVSMISCRQPMGVCVHNFLGDDFFNKRRNATFRLVTLA